MCLPLLLWYGCKVLHIILLQWVWASVEHVLEQQIYLFWSCINVSKANSSTFTIEIESVCSPFLSFCQKKPLAAVIWTHIWPNSQERKQLSPALVVSQPEWQMQNATDRCVCVCVFVCLRLHSAVPPRDKALEVLRRDDIISLGWCLPRLSQDQDALLLFYIWRIGENTTFITTLHLLCSSVF